MTADSPEGLDDLGLLIEQAMPFVFSAVLQVAPYGERLSDRLGFGEYVDAERDLARRFASQRFLDVLVKIEPTVIDDLIGEPLEAMTQFLRRFVSQAWAVRRFSDPTSTRIPDEAYLDLESFLEAMLTRLDEPVQEWMCRWNLGTQEQPWGAFPYWWTLLRWSLNVLAGTEPDRRLWDLPLLSDDDALLDTEPRFAPLMDEVAIKFPEFKWNRRLETRATVEVRIEVELKKILGSQLDSAERDARARGDVPTPLKPSGLLHFEWLAQYQVQGKTLSEIARASGVSRQSVEEAVKETASLIRLPLRKADRPGRPKRRPGPPRIVRVKRG